MTVEQFIGIGVYSVVLFAIAYYKGQYDLNRQAKRDLSIMLAGFQAQVDASRLDEKKKTN